MNSKEVQIINTVSDFMKQMCKGRDISHGPMHMLIVALLASSLLPKTHPILESHEKISLYVLIVALLHDVADHKYDPNGTLKQKVLELLITILGEADANLVMNIIDHISYSKENKAILAGTPIDFKAVLGEFGAYVRDFVSDADKLQASGREGLERCIEYTSHAYKEKHGEEIPPEVLKQRVIEHAHEKLFRLKDEFMRTEVGKEMAIIAHDELLREINKL